MITDFEKLMEDMLWRHHRATLQNASPMQLHDAIAQAVREQVYNQWRTPSEEKRAAYFSAEFLMGRMIFSNLQAMGLTDTVTRILDKHGADMRLLETAGDAALGNGGLGRLAACYLDAAATQNMPLDGYGIRYRYGIFKQYFEDGFQKETADDWLKAGDAWSERREDERVQVSFGDQTVWAVPYDMPIIGYGGKTVNNLRLWQAEAITPFDFTAFNAQKYDAAFSARNRAESISAVLYPNDNTPRGKVLRLKQQYFFVSASLQDILSRFANSGKNWAQLPQAIAIQLNDTHPVVAIPECIRLLTAVYDQPFDTALDLAHKVFAYTNHTLMPEALETWPISMFRRVLPAVFPVVKEMQKHLRKTLRAQGVTDFDAYDILTDDTLHMARMAVYVSHTVNGVAPIHSDLLKSRVLPAWHRLYPDRFCNITNGITQRRWLGVANPALASLITERIGDAWLYDLDALSALKAYADDADMLTALRDIRTQKKKALAGYLAKHCGVQMRWDFLVDTQVKRLHEYKRQLLNALSILDTYFCLKDGTLTDYTPTVYLFGAKAAPGYYRAKAIIKCINEISRLIAGDDTVNDRMQVIFVPDYSVSVAEKIVPATDISEQISTAGTEASGTGNMKFMLNGALTLGTWDGANIDIIERAGRENAFVCGMTVEEIEEMRDKYVPKSLLKSQPRLRRVVEALIDGTLDDGGSGIFADLHRALTEEGDRYFVLADFADYTAARTQANLTHRDSKTFFKMGLHNIANAGYFSADRAVKEYANRIWHIG